MEVNEDGFLEELLALRRETWEEPNNHHNHHLPPSTEIINGFFSTSAWSSTPFDALDSPPQPSPILPNPSLDSFHHSAFSSSSSLDPTAAAFADHHFYHLAGPDPTPFPGPDEYPMSIIDGEIPASCKDEPSSMSSGEVLTSSAAAAAGASNNGLSNNNNNINGLCMDMSSITNHNTINSMNGGTPTSANKSKLMKKVDGQPSKNLMAERRRRKRLNDRLSMLRSVVPKISKMDRTSILGDTIDYMKELLERINKLQEEVEVGPDQVNVTSIFKEANKANDVLVRNSPKFDVEKRGVDTRVEICCAGKPGLLLSTVTTLEALGLEIQQCVISCFSDFSLQASCSQEMDERTILGSEDIKQALFRNAGYGGRCL